MRASRPVVVFLLAVHAAAAQSPPPAGRPPNLSNQDDIALLKANTDVVSGGRVLNSCGTPVRPMLYSPAPDLAVVVEADPTGICSGSTLPSSVTIMLRGQGAWLINASSPGTGFRLGSTHGGRPDILIQSPTQRDCPVLRWNGQAYRGSGPCPGRHP